MCDKHSYAHSSRAKVGSSQHPMGFLRPHTMAKKIRVEPSGSHLKKVIALLLVRRLLAEWVVKGESIRMLEIRDISPNAFQKFPAPAKKYIPEILPLGELPGVKFEPPAGAPRRRWLTLLPEDVFPAIADHTCPSSTPATKQPKNS
jgi:hypothetical protein